MKLFSKIKSGIKKVANKVIEKLSGKSKKQKNKETQNESSYTPKKTNPYGTTGNELKIKSQRFIDIANSRLSEIKNSSFSSIAYEKVMAENGGSFFSINNLETTEELNAVMTQVNTFLHDSGSTLDGAKRETAQIASQMYSGQFGDYYTGYKRRTNKFNEEIIDGNIVKNVFSDYRRLKETYASEIINYGSDELISFMYSQAEWGENAFELGREMLDGYTEKEIMKYEDHMEENERTDYLSKYNLDKIRKELNF